MNDKLNVISLYSLPGFPGQLSNILQDYYNKIYHYELIYIREITHIYKNCGSDTHLFNMDYGIERVEVDFPTIIETHQIMKIEMRGCEDQILNFDHSYYSFESVEKLLKECKKKDIISINPNIPINNRFEILDL
jgi:hypothetical protein